MTERDDPLKPKYKRVLLKLSGEAFGQGGQTGISMDETLAIAHQVKRVYDRQVELAIVIGGGNLMRGATFSRGSIIKQQTADNMGMLATLMNGMALQEALEHIGCETRLQSAIRQDQLSEPFILRRAVRHLEKKRIVILAGGTGNPYVTTDSAAALRGRELGCEILLKATRVDGIYSEDPEKNPHATRYERITYERALRENLKVMDVSAFESCREGKLPILVFDYKKEGNIERAIAGQPIGTIVGE